MYSRRFYNDSSAGRRWPGQRPLALAMAAFMALLSTLSLPAQDKQIEAKNAKMLIVPLGGPLDKKTVDSTINSINSRIEKFPLIKWVVFKVDKGGGSHDEAIRMGDFIFKTLEKNEGKTTVAFIPSGSKVVGAAIIPVLACSKIAMGTEILLGAGELKDPPPEQKQLQRASDAVQEYSDQRRSQLLAGLMLIPAKEAIYALQLKNNKGYVFRTHNDLPGRDDLKFNYVGNSEILKQGQQLNLNQKTAYKYKWVEYAGIEDEDKKYNSLREKMKLPVADENVIDLYEGAVKKHPLDIERLVSFLNHPLTRFVLILGIILGITIELKMLGTMIPGLIAIVCFTLLIAGGLNGVPPTTTGFEVALFLIGLALIAIEFILAPGIAVLALSGSLLCFGSLVLAIVPSETIPGGDQLNTKEAFLLISTGLGTSAALLLFILRFLPTRMSGGIVNDSNIAGVPDADTAEESLKKTAHLIGVTGTCESPLRPAGIISLEDGQEMDVVADGEFIEKGERVIIRECTSTRIVVSRAEQDE